MADYSYTGSSDDWADTRGGGASPTYGDWLEQLKGATNQAQSALSSAASYGLESVGAMDAAQRAALSAHAGRNAAEQNQAAMTPAGQSAAQTWDHPASHIAMSAIGAIPEGAAVVGGAALGGIPGAAAVGGVLGAGHQIDATAAGMDSLPPGRMEDDPRYQMLLSGAKSPEDAELLYRNMLSDADGGTLLAGAGGAVGGAAGGAAKLVTGVAGKLLAGAGEAALAGGVQAATGNIAQQDTAVEGGWQKGVSGSELAGATLEGAGMGGAMGLVGGAAHGTAEPGVSGTDRRTRVDYRKPKTTSATDSANAPVVEIVTDAVVPDAAQTAAMTPAKPPEPVKPPEPQKPLAAAPAAPATPVAPEPAKATQRPPQAQETATPVTTEGNPPAPATDAAMPEAPNTLKLQQAQLTSGERNVMVFKGSTDLLPLPAGYRRFQLGPDTYDYNPGVYNRGDITKLVKTNKIGEALGLGPVTKDEVITRAAQGETPVAVVERAPNGTEARAAIGTEQTAPAQQAAIEQVATPGNTVAVEPPAPVIADRAAAQITPPPPEVRQGPDVRASDIGLAPKPDAPEVRQGPDVRASDIGLAPKPDAPVAPEPVAPTGRVLADKSDEGKSARDKWGRQVASAARDKWGRQVASAVAPEGGTGKHWSPSEREARTQANTVAQRVLAAHPPGETEPVAFGKTNTNDERKLTETRAKAMVQAARDAGLRFHEELTEAEKENRAIPRVPKRIGDAKDEGMNYSPAVIALREAKTVADRKVNEGPQLTEFRTREMQARAGDREGLTAIRREQGGIAMARHSIDAAPTDMHAATVLEDEGGASDQHNGDDTEGDGAHAVEGNAAGEEESRLDGIDTAREEVDKGSGSLNEPSDLVREAATTVARSGSRYSTTTDESGRIRRDYARERKAIVLTAADKAANDAWLAKHNAEKAARAAKAETPEPTSKAPEVTSESNAPAYTVAKGDMAKVQVAKAGVRQRLGNPNASQEGARKPISLRKVEPETRGRVQHRLIELGDNSHPRGYDINAAKSWINELSDADHAKVSKMFEGDWSPDRIGNSMEPDRLIANYRAYLDHPDTYRFGEENGETGALARERAQKDSGILPRDVEREDNSPAPIRAKITANSEPIELRPSWSGRLSDVDLRGTTELADATGSNFGPLHGELAARIQKLAGDVPLHFISREEMDKIPHPPKTTRLGFYDPHGKFMVMASDLTPEQYAETIPHEGIHALLSDEIAKPDSPIRQNIVGLAREVKAQLTPEQLASFNIKYAFSHPQGQEFITQGLMNPEFRAALGKVRISRQLAEQLELPKWRIASALQAFTAIIRKVLGYPKEQFTALEGLLKTFEQGAWAHDPGEAMAYASRHAEETMLAGDDPFAVRRKDDPFTQGRGALFSSAEDNEARDPGPVAAMREKLLSGVSDQIGNVKSWADERSAEYAPKFQSNDQYRQGVEHYFGKKNEENPVRRLVDGVERAGSYMRKLLAPADAVEGDLWRASRQHEGEDWDNFTKLINDSTTHNVNPDAALDSAANAHLRMPKGAENESDAAMGVWQSRAIHPELSAAYSALPRDLQALYQRARDYYAGERDARVKQHVRAILEAHEPPEGLTRDQAVEKVFDGTLTEAESEHYDQFGIGKVLKAADDLQKTRGPYFPLKRRGDYVVTGEHAVPGGATREFDTREEAHAWAAQQKLPTKVRSVYYDPETGEKTTKDKGLSTAGTAVRKYRGEVDNKHVAFAETKAKAEAVRQAMIDAGVQKVSAVDKVDRNHAVDYGLRGTQLDQLTKAVNRRTDLGEADKAKLVRSLEESSVALQRGNRLEHSFMRRRGVAGSSTDVIKNLSEFAHASAAFRSRAEFKASIEGALAEMRKTTEADRSSPDTLARRRVIQEYESRLEGFGSPEYQGKMRPMWQRLMAVSFLKRMLSPAHLALHLTHAPMVSAPLMAGRFGAAGAYRELFRAYNDLGARGAIGEGVKGMARNFKENGASTDFGSYFRKSLADQRDRVGLGDMLTELEATGHIHPDAGFDVSRYVDKDNRFDEGLSKVDHAFRELTSSTEAVNRYATATAAYRLAIRAGDDHEQAVRYAKDTVANSQGLFSRTNAPPVFRGAARPFLQFKQMPQVLIHLMGKLVHESFKWKEPEVQRQALRSFGTMMGAAALMSGVGGLPQDAAKAVFALGDALGVTPDWETEEANLHVALAHQLGPQLAGLIMGGVTGLGPTGVNVGHRMGYASLLTFGEPRSSRDSDVKAWLWDTMTGAPGSMVSDTWDGVKALRQGDIIKGVAKLAPAKFVGDIAKAADEYTQGKPNIGMKPIGEIPALMQAFGFEPREVQDFSDAHKAAQDAEKAQATPRKPGVGPKGEKILGLAATRKSRPLLKDYAESFGVQ